jgi:signal transduction histidine kinase
MEPARRDDFRVLLIAPTRRDREATLHLLQRARVSGIACDHLTDAVAAIDAGIGALLMTDAALTDLHLDELKAALARQPPWSEVPIILLCREGAVREAGGLENLTLLERPTSSRSLVSAVQAALRGRARQYELRDRFEEATRREAQLRVTEGALRDADRRKDLFLATLAHELRNPLAPIRTAAQILASPKLAPQQLQWSRTVIQRQVGHMAQLLDDLLDIARITQGKVSLRKCRVSFTDVVDAAIEAARPLIESKHHQLTVTLPPAPVTLDADPLRLAQVLSNLLTNAAKYTDPSGHIEVSAWVEAGTLSLSVRDDGIGIAAEALSRIFDMFSQVDGGSVRAEGGLGIGLALVKGLLDLHGGTIHVESPGPGMGSTFTVRLALGGTGAPARANVDAPAATAPVM